MAGAFFGSPSTSVRGWETAVAAQRRVVEAVQRHTADRHGSIAFVAHGAVGTLLWCDLSCRQSYREQVVGSCESNGMQLNSA